MRSTRGSLWLGRSFLPESEEHTSTSFSLAGNDSAPVPHLDHCPRPVAGLARLKTVRKGGRRAGIIRHNAAISGQGEVVVHGDQADVVGLHILQHLQCCSGSAIRDSGISRISVVGVCGSPFTNDHWVDCSGVPKSRCPNGFGFIGCAVVMRMRRVDNFIEWICQRYEAV